MWISNNLWATKSRGVFYLSSLSIKCDLLPTKKMMAQKWKIYYIEILSGNRSNKFGVFCDNISCLCSLNDIMTFKIVLEFLKKSEL